jgi:HD superfamily phosphodiesterase
MLALELEERKEAIRALNMDALIIAAYLHNISTAEYGFPDHHLKSAEMAVEFLHKLAVPVNCIIKVEQIILTHTRADALSKQEAIPLEGRILYDADKLGRLSGLAVVTSLIEFGARYPNRIVNAEILAAILRHIEERFIDLYQSLNTVPAHDMAREKFGNSLAFLDGVIEHLSDTTPV